MFLKKTPLYCSLYRIYNLLALLGILLYFYRNNKKSILKHVLLVFYCQIMIIYHDVLYYHSEKSTFFFFFSNLNSINIILLTSGIPWGTYLELIALIHCNKFDSLKTFFFETSHKQLTNHLYSLNSFKKDNLWIDHIVWSSMSCGQKLVIVIWYL